MNKHSIITFVAIMIIVIPFVQSGLNVFGTEQLEYRWHGPGQFSFFSMLNGGKVEFCNTIPFWVSFEKMEVAAFYSSKHVGSFVVEPLTLNPSSSGIQEGVFSSEDFESAQHVFMTLDFEFDGGDIRLDPNKFIIVIQTDTPILGIIPYLSTSQIAGFDFDQKMNSKDLPCD